MVRGEEVREEEGGCSLVEEGAADGFVFDGPHHLTATDLVAGSVCVCVCVCARVRK